MPIRIVDGEAEPSIKGNAYGWETRGGTPIKFPWAYGKPGGQTWFTARQHFALK